MTRERYTVEICATLLVDKPPKLPLREELPSLGFEIIYNAEGVADEVAQHQAQLALEQFRKEEAYREAKKLRIFPRSAQRIQQKEQLRKQMEEDLKTPHAFSYESYQHELYGLSSSFDYADPSEALNKIVKSHTADGTSKSKQFRQLVGARRLKHLGLFKTTKGGEEKKLMMIKGTNMDQVFSEANFKDLLSARSHETETTAAFTSANSGANTTISTRPGEVIQNMEIQFVASNSTDNKYLPELNTVQEANGTVAEDDSSAANAKGNLDDDVKGAFADIDATINALEDIKAVEAKSAALRKEEKERQARLEKKYDAAVPLFDALALPKSSLAKIEAILNEDPELVQVTQLETGRSPLHVLCQTAMPQHKEVSEDELTDHLLKDIAEFESAIQLVAGFYPTACKALDKKGDLPVHLLARTLMEWEAVWYETVYGEAAKENDPNGKTTTAISKLYQTMSECIEIVLRPVCASPELCRESGSVGEILPLHIAAIFTSTVSTLRTTLESYPQAAGILCKLGNMTTFVPDGSFALQLHEELSTDFPKWEVEAHSENNPDIKWSQAPSSKQGDQEDCIKRSDLLFAYYPNIEPCRLEKTRIRHIETLLHFEASRMTAIKAKDMTKAAQRLWRWMCIFTEHDSGRATYVNSVQRVLDGLPLQSVRYLAGMKTVAGIPLANETSAGCLAVIKRRLRDLEPTTVSMTHSYNSRTWQDQQWERVFQTLGGNVSLLCRAIFNIESGSFPTTFVVLPYELSRNSDGSLGMAYPGAAKVAVKFAECLLRLTEPAALLYFLEQKSTKHYEQSLFGEPSEAAKLEHDRNILRVQEYESKLLKLLGEQEAYLYLIDEATGTPVVPECDNMTVPVYPIVLRDPASIVKKIFPMMIAGMCLMRGEKALSVLVKVLFDTRIKVIATNWLEAAEDMIGYLDENSFGPEISKDITDLKDDLSSFVSESSRKLARSDSPNRTSEWNVERSILKMLLEEHDRSSTFAGLTVQSSDDAGQLWTCEGSRGPTEKDSLSKNFEAETYPAGETLSSMLHTFEPEESGCLTGWIAEVVHEFKTESEHVVSRRSRSVDSRGRQAVKIIDGTENKRSLSENSSRNVTAQKRVNQTQHRIGKVTSKSRRRSTSPKKNGRVHENAKNAKTSRDRSTRSRKPDLSEMSRKFDELTKMYDTMSSDSPSRSYRQTVSEHEYRQPRDERGNNIIDLTVGLDETDSTAFRTAGSTTTEEMYLLDVPASPIQAKMENLVNNVKAEALLSRSRNLLARANQRNDEAMRSRRQEKEFRNKHAMLFDEFAFNLASNDAHEEREPEQPRKGVSESIVIWHDLAKQLDSETYIDDHRVLLLKVKLAQEAKRLATIGKQVDGVVRQEMLATERHAECSGNPAKYCYSECYDSTQSLSRTRRLLIRICDLEDRLLCDDIEIQHLSLEAFSKDKQVDEIQEDLYGIPVTRTPNSSIFSFGGPPNEIRVAAKSDSVTSFGSSSTPSPSGTRRHGRAAIRRNNMRSRRLISNR